MSSLAAAECTMGRQSIIFNVLLLQAVRFTDAHVNDQSIHSLLLSITSPAGGR